MAVRARSPLDSWAIDCGRLPAAGHDLDLGLERVVADQRQRALAALEEDEEVFSKFSCTWRNVWWKSSEAVLLIWLIASISDSRAWIRSSYCALRKVCRATSPRTPRSPAG